MPEQLLFNISNKREKERKVWRMWAAVKEKENRREEEEREKEKEKKKKEMAAPMYAISHMTGKDH
jgi:hypothetical protein